MRNIWFRFALGRLDEAFVNDSSVSANSKNSGESFGLFSKPQMNVLLNFSIFLRVLSGDANWRENCFSLDFVRLSFYPGNELFRHWTETCSMTMKFKSRRRRGKSLFYRSFFLRKFSILKIDTSRKTLASQSYRDKYDRTSDTKLCIVCCKFITSSHTFGIWKRENQNEIVIEANTFLQRENISRDSFRLFCCKKQKNLC